MCLPRWVAKIIKVVGDYARDINYLRKFRSKDQCGSGALIEHGLEACDIDTYENSHGLPQWENTMAKEYHSLMKKKTYGLVP